MKNGSTAKGRSSWSSKLVNPVLDKEFRLRMRTPRSMWAIFFYVGAMGAAALAFIYLMTEINRHGPSAFNPEESRMMFIFISFAQMGLIAFMAPGLTAGVISGEREKQTLNLLLTTQQSSATIILSKLVSSLAFMILIVLATMPVYSIVFLYGGISPWQLLGLFLFFVFVMFVLGAFGLLFSTLFKRTMLAVIATYGVTLFLFIGTALMFLFLNGVLQELYRNVPSTGAPPYRWIGHLLALNPAAAMYSILEPSLTRQAFFVSGMQGNAQSPMTLWQEFILIYSIVTSLLIGLSIRYLRPRLKRRT